MKVFFDLLSLSCFKARPPKIKAAATPARRSVLQYSEMFYIVRYSHTNEHPPVLLRNRFHQKLTSLCLSTGPASDALSLDAVVTTDLADASWTQSFGLRDSFTGSSCSLHAACQRPSRRLAETKRGHVIRRICMMHATSFCSVGQHNVLRGELARKPEVPSATCEVSVPGKATRKGSVAHKMLNSQEE